MRTWNRWYKNLPLHFDVCPIRVSKIEVPACFLSSYALDFGVLLCLCFFFFCCLDVRDDEVHN